MDVKNFNLTSILIVIIFLTACTATPPKESAAEDKIVSAQLVKRGTLAVAEQQEIDEIFMLLAYAVVYKDWQADGIPSPRGHNIGSVLVDDNHRPVFWARNANAITNNGSQHGEVRLIRNYLNCAPDKYLSKYTVYTTLEPCAMCSGMMSLTKLSRAVYGQKDTGYGDALERLALDSSSLAQGYEPYPRLFESLKSTSVFTRDLDAQYASSGESNITKFLRSDYAESVFAAATHKLMSLDEEMLNFRLSKVALSLARDFLKNVSEEYVEDPEALCRSTQ